MYESDGAPSLTDYILSSTMWVCDILPAIQYVYCYEAYENR